MATNLQVNASTQQAVGAFNQLAASIQNTTNRFNQLNGAMAQGNQGAGRYAGGVTAINTAFSRLQSILGSVIGGITRFAAGLQLVLGAVISSLDRLQGFMAIMSVSTKSVDDVSNSYSFLRSTADRLGVQFDSLTSNYAKLVAALPPGLKSLETAEKVFMGIANAARTLHSSNTDVQLMFYAVTQMASKGVLSMEELRQQLGEKLPGAISIASKALNTTPELLQDAIRKGIVSSEKFLPLFGDALIRTFTDSAEKAATSVSASLNRLTNVWTDFVKEILDSGAGDAIAGIFDAIREKLSDPYVIERFAVLIQYLGDRFTAFISTLTEDDIRNGFDTFTNAIELVIDAVQKLVELVQWIINNGGKAGAIVGGLAGVSVGALAGPWGAVVGGLAGASAGAYMGSQIGPDASDASQRASSDSAGLAASEAARVTRENIRIKILTESLQKFKGLNSLEGLDKMFDSARLTQKTISDLDKLAADPRFKTEKSRVEALREYAKFGVLMGPTDATLESTFTPAKPKGEGAAQRSMDATLARALGLTTDYSREMGNLNKLLASGKLGVDQYSSAVQDLIAKQPYMIEYTKETEKQLKAENVAMTDFISTIIKQVEARDLLRQTLDEDLRMAGMRSDDLRIEQQVTQSINSLNEAGLEVTAKEVELLRERYRLINDAFKVSQAEDQFLSMTVNRFEAQVNQIRAMRKAIDDPTSGATQSDASNVLVQQNQTLFQGTQEYYEFQRSQAADWYATLQAWRNQDFISEQTHLQLKNRIAAQASEERLSIASQFFGNFASLTKSSNRTLFEIGKAAAVAQALVDGYAAVNKVFATMPPPWSYIMAASIGAVTAMNVRAITSTKMGSMAGGGFAGAGPRDQVAGYYHNEEFVMNAAATSRNRAALEAMNAGRKVNASNSGEGVSNNIYVINNADGTRVRQEERDNATGGKDIELTIESVVTRSVQRGGSIARSIEGTYNLNRAVSASR